MRDTPGRARSLAFDAKSMETAEYAEYKDNH